jgi:hypothetical protein
MFNLNNTSYNTLFFFIIASYPSSSRGPESVIYAIDVILPRPSPSPLGLALPLRVNHSVPVKGRMPPSTQTEASCLLMFLCGVSTHGHFAPEGPFYTFSCTLQFTVRDAGRTQPTRSCSKPRDPPQLQFSGSALRPPQLRFATQASGR